MAGFLDINDWSEFNSTLREVYRLHREGDDALRAVGIDPVDFVDAFGESDSISELSESDPVGSVFGPIVDVLEDPEVGEHFESRSVTPSPSERELILLELDKEREETLEELDRLEALAFVEELEHRGEKRSIGQVQEEALEEEAKRIYYGPSVQELYSEYP